MSGFGRKYSVAEFGWMIACAPRFDAFRRALEAVVFPGCHVLEIGTGVGAFAILAARYGAGSVVALEPNPAIEIARRAAQANGVADRIRFVEAISTDHVPDRPANVILSDLRGALPFYGNHIPSIIDARDRLLAPGGRLLPQRDRLFAALVEDDGLSGDGEVPWLENAVGIDLTAGHPFAVNSFRTARIDEGSLLGDPACLAVLDYACIDSADFRCTAELTVSRPGRAAGLALWFDMEIAPGIEISNRPGAAPLVYRQIFFPLERALDLADGDRVELAFAASLRAGSYNFTWETAAFRRNEATAFARFRQASAQGEVLTPSMLGGAGAGRRDAARMVLDLLEAGRAETEIADILAARHTRLFATSDAAAAFVRDMTALLG
ncbi:50S ribosomal protein L11 methyltransferase [Tropicimonas sp. IMCC6043]|uniref:50S ribosomal protein L11 methyltransferase n=1 Tax=Tropicimonas sp. IMCC6043 TaxID=2510645 RepID=UPI0013EE2321|nr:50S ribosomal protein L11 methyltransferase [Tropicimonas sp. IMCC6043]